MVTVAQGAGLAYRLSPLRNAAALLLFLQAPLGAWLALASSVLVVFPGVGYVLTSITFPSGAQVTVNVYLMLLLFAFLLVDLRGNLRLHLEDINKRRAERGLAKRQVLVNPLGPLVSVGIIGILLWIFSSMRDPIVFLVSVPMMADALRALKKIIGYAGEWITGWVTTVPDYEKESRPPARGLFIAANILQVGILPAVALATLAMLLAATQEAFLPEGLSTPLWTVFWGDVGAIIPLHYALTLVALVLLELRASLQLFLVENLRKHEQRLQCRRLHGTWVLIAILAYCWCAMIWWKPLGSPLLLVVLIPLSMEGLRQIMRLLPR